MKVILSVSFEYDSKQNELFGSHNHYVPSPMCLQIRNVDLGLGWLVALTRLVGCMCLSSSEGWRHRNYLLTWFKLGETMIFANL